MVIAGEKMISVEGSVAVTLLDGVQTIVSPEDGLQATQQHPSPAVPGVDGPILQETTVDTPGVPEDDGMEPLAEEAPVSSFTADTETIVSPELCLESMQEHPSPLVPVADVSLLEKASVETSYVPDDDGILPLPEETPVSCPTGDTQTIVTPEDGLEVTQEHRLDNS